MRCAGVSFSSCACCCVQQLRCKTPHQVRKRCLFYTFRVPSVSVASGGLQQQSQLHGRNSSTPCDDLPPYSVHFYCLHSGPGHATASAYTQSSVEEKRGQVSSGRKLLSTSSSSAAAAAKASSTAATQIIQGFNNVSCELAGVWTPGCWTCMQGVQHIEQHPLRVST